MTLKRRIEQLEKQSAGLREGREGQARIARALASVKAKFAALMASNPPTVAPSPESEVADLRWIRETLEARAGLKKG